MIKIRQATTSDVKSLSEIAELCFIDTFGHLYSEENLSNHLKETCSLEFFSEAMARDKILLAEDGQKLVGYIKFGKVGLPIKPIPENSVEIQRLYILPKFKRQGIGGLLMKSAFDEQIMKEAENYYLSVYEDNIPAQKFYKSYGFAKVGEYDYYVGSHMDREHIMHLQKLKY